MFGLDLLHKTKDEKERTKYMATTPVTPAAPETEAQKIAQSLVFIGLSIASIFVKNPASQAKAGSIAQILEELIPFM